MLISPNQPFSSLQFEPVVLNRSMPSLQNYPDRVPKRKSRALDGTVPLSQRLLSALIIQDGSETAESIAMLQDELSQFSSKYSQRTLEERISLELRSIGLLMDAVGDQENNDLSHKPGASKAGKKAGLDVAKRTGRSCFNKLTSRDVVVLSEPVCSKDANCIDDIGSGTASNANIDSHDPRLGSWASGSSGATPINEKPALGPKVGTRQLDKIVVCMPEQTLAKSVVLTDTNSVFWVAPTLNDISRIPKRKRTTRGRKRSEVRNTTSADAGSSTPSNGRGESKTKKRKWSEVRNMTSANAGSSIPSSGRGESKTKAKRKRKMIRLSSLGSGLENIKETSPVGVKQKNTQKRNTKAKSSAKTKTKAKAKEKVDHLSASESGLGSIEATPSSSSPSKGESGESVSTGATGINEEAGLVFPQDWCLDIDGLSSLEIPDDIESWLVDGLSVEAELHDRVAFLEIPMDDLLDVNRCFRRE